MKRQENVFLDSQILNLIADGSDADMDVLAASENIQLLMPYSVVSEVDKPSTPAHVKKAASELIRSLQVGLNAEERADMAAFTAALMGKKKPENIVPDLKHAWEARKYGRFLISVDHDLLSRAEAIRGWNGLHVLRPAEARALHDAMVGTVS
jgi:hypothetical protein